MTINFCGYDENTTVGQIREDFSDVATAKDKLSLYRTGDKGKFDAVMAVILGGWYTTTVPCRKNYGDVAYSGQQKNGWPSNAVSWTTGDRNTNAVLKNFVETQIQEGDTLAQVYEKMNQWTGWGCDDAAKDAAGLKRAVLARLAGADVNVQQVAGQRKAERAVNFTGYITENKQVVFTGAPGTGKTYSVRKTVEELTDGDKDCFRFIQFHPSYDYSDFVEGLRPVTLGTDKNPTFVRMDGVFKEFCRKIVHWNLKELVGDQREDEKLTEEERRKQIEARKGMLKQLKEMTDEKERDGLIHSLTCDYYFMIDEINRADISKVFGELMFGLEETYRGAQNAFDTQYMNLTTYAKDTGDNTIKPVKEIYGFDCFEEGFFLPENLHIIGTMNDIDRSVESFDFAMRRRFQWIDVKANEVMGSVLVSMKVIDDENDPVVGRIQGMNRVLSDPKNKFGLTPAYHIGPAYFKNYRKDNGEESLKEIFAQRVEPILREYTRGRNEESVRELIETCRKTLLGKAVQEQPGQDRDAAGEDR